MARADGLRALRADDPLRPASTRARSTRRARVAQALGVDAASRARRARCRRSAARRCVGDGADPEGSRRSTPRDIPSTYVPARNTVFLSLALAWAEVLGADAIVIGVNALDYSGYPDCRPEYLRAFERLARAGDEGRRRGTAAARARAAARSCRRRDIIRRGLALGLDYGLTHSCYDPAPDGRPCGHCDSCLLRARGFARRGIADPVAAAEQRRDRTALLHRSLPARVRRRASSNARPTTAGPRSCSIAPRSIPTSGGQPFDTGTLGDARVVDVVDDDDGRIAARRRSRRRRGDAVHGAIDWTRRFDHMQQHTGQHVLSAAFDRAARRARTESFHLGVESSTIDLGARGAGAEIAARRGRGEPGRLGGSAGDDPVRVRRGGRGAAAAQGAEARGHAAADRRRGLRSVGVRRHARLAHRRDRHHRRVRDRAVPRRDRGSRSSAAAAPLTGFRALRDAVAGSVRALSVLPAELPAAIERLQGGGQGTSPPGEGLPVEGCGAGGRRAGGRRRQLSGSVRLVAAALTGWDAAGLKTIASRIVERPGHLVVLVSRSCAARPIVVARASDVAHDAGALLRAIVARHGGKGGGRPEMAQGGGVTAPAPEVLATARELVGQPSS